MDRFNSKITPLIQIPTKSELIEFFSKIPNLEDLQITSSIRILNMILLNDVIWKCQNLTCLDIYISTITEAKAFEYFVEKTPKVLKELALGINKEYENNEKPSLVYNHGLMIDCCLKSLVNLPQLRKFYLWSNELLWDTEKILMNDLTKVSSVNEVTLETPFFSNLKIIDIYFKNVFKLELDPNQGSPYIATQKSIDFWNLPNEMKWFEENKPIELKCLGNDVRSLEMDRCESCFDLKSIFQAFPNLEELQIAQIHSDSTPEPINSMRKLVVWNHSDLYKSPKVALLSSMPNLKYFSIEFHDSYNSKDPKEAKIQVYSSHIPEDCKIIEIDYDEEEEKFVEKQLMKLKL